MSAKLGDLPELADLCICVENVRRPALSSLNSYLEIRGPSIRSDLLREIKVARKTPDEYYAEFGKRANSISFTSDADFVKWLNRMRKAILSAGG